MKTSTKRILSIGLAGLFFIGTLIVYASFIKPEAGKVSEARSLTASKENLFNNQRLAVEEVQKLIGQFQSIAKLEETVSLAMPRGESITQALNQLQAIVRSSKVNLKAFTINPGTFEPSRQPLAKRLGSIKINVTVEGSYENIKNFLWSLETNVRVANIASFVMSPLSGGGAQDLYSLTALVEIYYQE